MRTLTILAIALLASSAALAQPMGGHGGGGGHMMMGGGGHCMMMQRTEGALAFLKTELKIASSQERAWNAFADAYREAAGGAHEGHGKKHDHATHAKHGKAQSFLDKAQHHVEMMDKHRAGFKSVYDAAKPLYEALNPDQRKAADELLMHFLMPHHGGGM